MLLSTAQRMSWCVRYIFGIPILIERTTFCALIQRLLLHSQEWLSSGHQWVSKKCNNDKVVVFERGDAVFVFNWHPTQSYTGYRVGCKDQGKYKILLNSDSPTFGGWGNVKDETEFYTQHGHDNRPHSLMVYAPARTVVVYAPAHYLEKANDPLEEFCDANPSEAECLVYDETA